MFELAARRLSTTVEPSKQVKERAIRAQVQWYDESRAYKLSFKQQMSPAG